jgi:hypothetical protein
MGDIFLPRTAQTGPGTSTMDPNALAASNKAAADRAAAANAATLEQNRQATLARNSASSLASLSSGSGSGSGTGSYGGMSTGSPSTGKPPVGTEWDATRNMYVPSSKASSVTAKDLAPGSQYQTDSQGRSTFEGISPADAPSSLAGLTNAANMAELNRKGELTATAQQKAYDEANSLLASTSKGTASAPNVAFPTDQIHSAQDLAFARAKDRVGQNARASVDALRSEMTGRGIGSAPGAPSGIEANAEAGVIGAGGGQLADTITQQASDEAAQGVQNAQNQYAGNITQRGQTLNALTTQQASILGLIRAGGAY